MAGIKDQLNELIKVDGVKTAVVVGRDGFVIEGITSDGSVDIDAVGAVISTGLGTAEVMGRELKVGGLTQAMQEYDEGVLVMSALGAEALLCLVCQLEANLGMVRFQTKKHIPALRAAM